MKLPIYRSLNFKINSVANRPVENIYLSFTGHKDLSAKSAVILNYQCCRCKKQPELRESIKRSSDKVQVAVGRTERIGDAAEGLERIVREVEKRGRSKD